MIDAVIGNMAEDGMITREFIQKHYLDENKTLEECAQILGISRESFSYYVTKFNLSKMDGAGRYKDPRFNKRIGLKYDDVWKQNIKLGQPHAKRVVRISKKGGRKVYNNITEAARENGLFRENVRACCYGRHHTAGGYKFMFLRTYGEEIVHRLINLDFRKPIDEMMSGIYAGLPERMDKTKASIYYTNKLNQYWKMA